MGQEEKHVQGERGPSGIALLSAQHLSLRKGLAAAAAAWGAWPGAGGF